MDVHGVDDAHADMVAGIGVENLDAFTLAGCFTDPLVGLADLELTQVDSDHVL